MFQAPRLRFSYVKYASQGMLQSLPPEAYKGIEKNQGLVDHPKNRISRQYS
jgi:hypothetical protein